MTLGSLIHTTTSVRLTTSITTATFTKASTNISSTSSTSSTSPTELSGSYEYPHLIVPVDDSKPETALGVSYEGVVSPTVSSLFNFDIPASYAGKNCNVVLLFPDGSQQWQPAATFKTPGGITVQQLTTPASTTMTYANVPKGQIVGSVSHLEAGHGYTISTGPCAAGKTLGYRIDSADGLDLQFFQSINPPLGFFITVS